MKSGPDMANLKPVEYCFGIQSLVIADQNPFGLFSRGQSIREENRHGSSEGWDSNRKQETCCDQPPKVVTQE